MHVHPDRRFDRVLGWVIMVPVAVLMGLTFIPILVISFYVELARDVARTGGELARMTNVDSAPVRSRSVATKGET